MPKLQRLEPGFGRTLANAIVGTDCLFGADAGSPNAADHIIADSFPREELELPPAFRDSRARALRRG